MVNIPPVFWMVIIASLAILFGLIMFYVAMMFRQLVMTLEETTSILQKSNTVIDESTEIVSSVKSMVKGIQENIIEPLMGIGRVFKIISSFIDGVMSRTPDSSTK